MSAIELLEKAADHLKDRAATYDKPEGERSISAAAKRVRLDAVLGTEPTKGDKHGTYRHYPAG